MNVLSPCDPSCNMCSGSVSSTCVTTYQKSSYCDYFVPDNGTNFANPWEGVY